MRDFTTMTELIDLSNDEEEDVSRYPLYDDSDENDVDTIFDEDILMHEWSQLINLGGADSTHRETYTASKAGTLIPSIGMTVEMSNGDFMYITHIIKGNTSQECTLRGIHLRRNRNIDVIAPKKANEVSAFIEIFTDEACPSIFAAPIERDISQAIVERILIFTNEDDAFWRAPPNPKPFKREEEGHLVCRRKCIQYCSVRKNEVYVHGGAVLNLTEAECDRLAGKTGSDVAKWLHWQNGQPCRQQDQSRANTEATHAYTFFDVCAGGGSVTAAAERRGLTVKFALDCWASACRTLRLNFPRATIYQMEIHDFLVLYPSLDGRVDILHISFPCPPFSPKHPNFECAKDEQNIATNFSAQALLDRCRPRVVTFEQTSGLATWGMHRDYLNAAIMQFTSKGYSVRWKTLSCDRYGNVQARKRLFFIAACPGEPLPEFPQPTHGREEGLQRPETVADKLALLPNVPNQDHMLRRYEGKATSPYDANLPLKDALLTDCHKTPHPDGRRYMSLQEIALMGGFSAGHLFAEDSIANIGRQIGNAVPGGIMEAMFKMCIKSMRDWDQIIAQYVPGQDAIVIE